LLEEYQDSVEKFLMMNIKPVKTVRWSLDRGFVIKVYSEQAYEEPCLSVLRSSAFVPFLWKFLTSRARQGWHKVGEDLYYSSLREALSLKEILRHMGEAARAALFSAFLGGFMGAALLSLPFRTRLSELFDEFLSEGGCRASYLGEALVEADGPVLSVSYPLSSTASLGASVLGHPFVGMADALVEGYDPLEVLEGGLQYFKGVGELMRGEPGIRSEGGCWREVRGRALRGHCAFPFELDEPLPGWAWRRLSPPLVR